MAEAARIAAAETAVLIVDMVVSSSGLLRSS